MTNITLTIFISWAIKTAFSLFGLYLVVWGGTVFYSAFKSTIR